MQEELRRVQEMFSICTRKYKAEYKMELASNRKDVLGITCKLVENIVSVCGEEWRQCHTREEVRRMKDLQVENIIIKNRGQLPVDIEQCTTVQQFRLAILFLVIKLQCPCPSNRISVVNIM